MEESVEYSINIKMSSATARELSDDGYDLYGFKAVKASGTGSPLVWLETDNYSTNTRISWKQNYQVYTSNTEINADSKIEASHSAPISLGQVLTIDHNTGTGEVRKGGPKNAISVQNRTQRRFTVGISQKPRNSKYTNPLCALRLNPNHDNIIQPIEKIMLIFATQSIDTGTVIYKAFGPGVLIDLTAEPSREIKYDVSKGWDWDDQLWAKDIRHGEPIKDHLIRRPARSPRTQEELDSLQNEIETMDSLELAAR